MAYVSTLPTYSPIRISFDGIKTLFAVYSQRRALSQLDDAALQDIGITYAQAVAESRRLGWDTTPLSRHQ